MRRFSSLIIALLITASIVPGLVGCASAADSVKEAVDPVLESYAVDKGSDESKDLPDRISATRAPLRCSPPTAST